MDFNKVDVLIVGSGSAGLCAATYLSRMSITHLVLEKRLGPLELGQADGVQCRTVEIFESFGMSEELLTEAYHIIEVAFWSAENNQIRRTGRTADTKKGLSWMPHVILNQARINALFVKAIERFGGPRVQYGWTVKSLEIRSVIDGPENLVNGKRDNYPITVRAEKNGHDKVFQAKYVLGCDGAHSQVRKALGYRMIGDTTDAVWGVMDVHVRTNFPDIRRKVTIHSDYGALLIIPREEESLVRFYIELPHGTQPKTVKLEQLHASAQKIFQGYEIEYAHTVWWSAYSIGQRLVESFSKSDRIFLTGDACHTHSPKAGQGMNISLQDGYNISWKLAYVLKGVSPTSLISTYSPERRGVAAKLLEFDRTLSKLFSMKDSQDSPEDFSSFFVDSGRYTAGLNTKYQESMLIAVKASQQQLATEIVVGMRFPSAQVVRFCDARAMQLARSLPSDGKWRIVVISGRIDSPNQRRKLHQVAYLGQLSQDFANPSNLISQCLPSSKHSDALIELLLVIHGSSSILDQIDIPDVFRPAVDLHKVFVDDQSYNLGHGHAYKVWGVNPQVGAVVIVRPDQYVSMVTSLDDFGGIEAFFGNIFTFVKAT